MFIVAVVISHQIKIYIIIIIEFAICGFTLSGHIFSFFVVLFELN